MKKSLYKTFCEKWKDGCGGSVCDRSKKVFCRGKVPCEVLFIGIAPGESEGSLGVPFIGPAGKLIDSIILRSLSSLSETREEYIRYAFTNLVLCMPRDEDGYKTDVPDDSDVESCSNRLVEFITLCNPKLIVCVGALVKDYIMSGWKRSLNKRINLALRREVSKIELTHPARILRSNIAQQELLIRRCVVTLQNAIWEFVLQSGRQASQ
jgi:uracil-DNA glycosylase